MGMQFLFWPYPFKVPFERSLFEETRIQLFEATESDTFCNGICVSSGANVDFLPASHAFGRKTGPKISRTSYNRVIVRV